MLPEQVEWLVRNEETRAKETTKAIFEALYARIVAIEKTSKEVKCHHDKYFADIVERQDAWDEKLGMWKEDMVFSQQVHSTKLLTDTKELQALYLEKNNELFEMFMQSLDKSQKRRTNFQDDVNGEIAKFRQVLVTMGVEGAKAKIERE